MAASARFSRHHACFGRSEHLSPTLRAQPGITNVELDALLKVLQATATALPSGLSDTTPVNYFGVSVTHGYVAQPASRLSVCPTRNPLSAFPVRASSPLLTPASILPIPCFRASLSRVTISPAIPPARAPSFRRQPILQRPQPLAREGSTNPLPPSSTHGLAPTSRSRSTPPSATARWLPASSISSRPRPKSCL